MIKKTFSNLKEHKIISGSEIGLKIGISRSAINKHIKILQESGVKINTEHNGYSYEKIDNISQYEIDYLLKTKNINLEVLRVNETESTNTLAKTLVNNKDFLLYADMQTKGRGRLERTFVANEGGIYMTLCLKKENLLAKDSLWIVLFTALAVCEVLEEYSLAPTIKWPNDIFVNDKKICGILLEGVLNFEFLEKIIIGIGINAKNDISAIENIATSLANEHINFYRQDIIVNVIEKLLLFISFENKYELQKKYLQKSRTIGKVVEVKIKEDIVKGFAKGLTEDGYLILENENGEMKIITGDVM